MKNKIFIIIFLFVSIIFGEQAEITLLNESVSGSNLGGFLTFDIQSTGEIDFEDIPSGSTIYAPMYGLNDIWTNQSMLSNKKHINWNGNDNFYLLKKLDYVIPEETVTIKAKFDQQLPISINGPQQIEISDPWWVTDETNLIQSDEFHTVSGSYDVFLRKGSFLHSTKGTYKIKASPEIYSTTDGIYKFDSWVVTNGDAEFNNQNSSETKVKFNESNTNIEANYVAVNMIEDYTLQLSEGQDLTVPAGADIQCAEGFKIETEANISLIGTEENPIRMYSNSEVEFINNEYEGGWDGINITGFLNNQSIEINYAIIENAKTTVDLRNGNLDGKNLIIKNSVIIDAGIFVTDKWNAADNLQSEIVNNTVSLIDNNFYDFNLSIVFTTEFNMYNNIFINCSYNFDHPLGKTNSYYYENLLNNVFYNCYGREYDDNFTFDPNLDSDYRPNFGSPVIDAGIVVQGVTAEEDPDGTDLDIGAYYFPQLSGNISGQLSGSVSIVGNVTIPSGNTLTIAPGTIIKLNSNKVITVYGELRAEGTSANRVTFTKNGSNDWSKIYARSNSNIYLNHTEISDAYVGLHADNSSSVNIYNSEFKNSVAGIWMENCNSNHIDDNTFNNNDYCGLYLQYATTNLNGNVISNSYSGIEGSCVYGNYRYNNIHDNTYGIYLYDDSAPDLTLTTFFPDLEETFRNNMIADNDYGIYVYSGYPQLGNYVVDMGYLTVTGGFNEFDNVGYDVYNEDDEIDARLNIWESYEIDGDVETDPDFYEFLDEWGLGKTTGDKISQIKIYTIADSLIADSLFTEAFAEYELLIAKMSKEDISKKTLIKIVALNRRLTLDSLYQEQFTDETLVKRLEKISNKYPDTPVGNLSLDMQVTTNNWSGEYDKAITLGDKLYIKYTQNNDDDNAASILYKQSLALRYKAETETDGLSKSEELIKQSEAKADLILSQYPRSSASNAVRMSRGLAPIMIDNEPITNAIPDEFALHNCYPNPFNPVTNIVFDLPKDSKISLVAYNIMGRKVWEYENNEKVMEAGEYEIQWNGKTTENKQLASGIYLIQLRTASFVDVRKVVLLK